MECPHCRSTDVTSTGRPNLWQCLRNSCERTFNRDTQARKLGIIKH